MKILLLSDIADKALWDYLDRSLLEGIELVLACGGWWIWSRRTSARARSGPSRD